MIKIVSISSHDEIEDLARQHASSKAIYHVRWTLNGAKSNGILTARLHGSGSTRTVRSQGTPKHGRYNLKQNI